MPSSLAHFHHEVESPQRQTWKKQQQVLHLLSTSSARYYIGLGSTAANSLLAKNSSNALQWIDNVIPVNFCQLLSCHICFAFSMSALCLQSSYYLDLPDDICCQIARQLKSAEISYAYFFKPTPGKALSNCLWQESTESCILSCLIHVCIQVCMYIWTDSAEDTELQVK